MGSRGLVEILGHFRRINLKSSSLGVRCPGRLEDLMQWQRAILTTFSGVWENTRTVRIIHTSRRLPLTCWPVVRYVVSVPYCTSRSAKEVRPTKRGASHG